jgi:hypothetical protein
MAVSIIFQNNRYQNDYHQYVADTPDDVKKIRVSPSDMGSEVYVISEKKTYILDSNRTWHVKIVNTSGSGSGDDIVDGGTIECDHNHVDESTVWEPIPEPSVG